MITNIAIYMRTNPSLLSRMAPSARSERARNGDRNHATNPDMSAAEAALKAKLSRKRTKTGCLTCRKRRIKCGEERPICKNCFKSKRQCEGYSQRVVFKQSAFDVRTVPNGGAQITFPAGPIQDPAAAYQEYGQPVFDPGIYSNLQPRPVEQYAPSFHHPPQQQVAIEQSAVQFAQWPQASPGVPPPGPDFALSSTLPQQQPMPIPGPALPYHSFQNHNFRGPGPMHTPGVFVPLEYAPQASQFGGLPADQANGHMGWQQQYVQGHEQNVHLVSPVTSTAPDKVSPASRRSSNTLPWNQPFGTENPFPAWTNHSYVPRPELCRPIDYQPPPVKTEHGSHAEFIAVPVTQTQDHMTPEFYEHEEHVTTDHTPTYFLTQAAVETQDDDYYDVHSDEETDVHTLALTTVDQERQRELQRILQVADIPIQDLQTRRYDTFIHGGALKNYKPEEVASPLRNPTTARVFAHFISATGPSLSIFERHPRNSSVLFNDGQVPISQQALWTYTMPMAALHHQGLLHAMLALASLHIARLTGAHQMPSIQHYTWALKRVHRCVSHPKKRFKVTTMAASMLLGFYEIMAADHMKWNMHLSGSKQLFLETDFVTMTQQFRRMKAERAALVQMGNRRRSLASLAGSQDEILDNMHDVDERFVSELVGTEVRYEDHGRIMTPKSGTPPELDLSNFEILKDLYWWYLKQDVYQSIVSGNPLL